jgi:hypothetical protein
MEAILNLIASSQRRAFLMVSQFLIPYMVSMMKPFVLR